MDVCFSAVSGFRLWCSVLVWVVEGVGLLVVVCVVWADVCVVLRRLVRATRIPPTINTAAITRPAIVK